MSNQTKIVPGTGIARFIFSIRDQRVMLDNDLAALAVQGNFHGVDAAVVGDHLVAQGPVAGAQRVKGAADLGFDQAAHLQHARADRFQLGVELLRKVFVQVGPLVVGCRRRKARSAA